MTQETRTSLLESTNAIISLNGIFLGKLGEMEKDLSEDQQKNLADASTKLIQAANKILESCK